MMPDLSRPFQIESDASKYATGAVLTQQDSNGSRHPVSFISKTFSPAERNYEIYDRELLGIIRALDEWRHYVQGSPHTTTILSDHLNLTYWRSPQKLNPRQARWSLKLSEYDLKLVHTSRTSTIPSHPIHRRPDLLPYDDNSFNSDKTMLSDGSFGRITDRVPGHPIAGSTDMDVDARDAL